MFFEVINYTPTDIWLLAIYMIVSITIYICPLYTYMCSRAPTHIFVGPIVKNVDSHVGYYIKHRQEREDQITSLLSNDDHSINSIVEVSVNANLCFSKILLAISY